MKSKKKMVELLAVVILGACCHLTTVAEYLPENDGTFPCNINPCKDGNCSDSLSMNIFLEAMVTIPFQEFIASQSVPFESMGSRRVTAEKYCNWYFIHGYVEKQNSNPNNTYTSAVYDDAIMTCEERANWFRGRFGLMSSQYVTYDNNSLFDGDHGDFDMDGSYAPTLLGASAPDITTGEHTKRSEPDIYEAVFQERPWSYLSYCRGNREENDDANLYKGRFAVDYTVIHPDDMPDYSEQQIDVDIVFYDDDRHRNGWYREQDETKKPSYAEDTTPSGSTDE
jgi:hypothetical protein